MKTRALKLLATTLICSLTAQVHAQNVTATKLSQYETTLFQESLKQAVQKSARLWEKSSYLHIDRNSGLESIFKKTADFLKSPNRVQKTGGLDGGGGNSLLCEKDGKYSIDLLDLDEAVALNVPLDFGPGETFPEKLDYIFKRLSKISPLRAHVYQTMAKRILTQDTQWVENTAMPVIDDIKLATIRRGCLLVQTAVQRPIEQRFLPNAKPYIIDKDVFNLLDENSKAMLILHEVLYREARFSLVTDSIFVRNLAGVLSSTQISDMSLANLNALMAKNGVKCVEDIKNSILIGPVVTMGQDSYSQSCNHAENVKLKINAQLEANYVNHYDYVSDNSTLKLNLKGDALPVVLNTSEANIPFNGILTYIYSSVPKKKDMLPSNMDIQISLLSSQVTLNNRFGRLNDKKFNSLDEIFNLVFKSTSSFRINAKKINFNIPNLKLIPSCKKQEEDCEETIVLNNEWLEAPDQNLLVYIGLDKNIPTENGWLKANKIMMEGSKIKTVYYDNKVANL